MKYTDNVRFNHKLNLLFLIFSFSIFSSYKISVLDSVIKSVIFVLIYAFSSAFIQPDLDQAVQRPGKTTFPLGQLKNNKIGGKLFPVLYPLNRIWYYFWHPYGAIFTHRGVSHWPIIGTLTRAGYVLLIALGIDHLVPALKMAPIINYLMLYFPTEYNRSHFDSFSLFWMTYILPFFVSDAVHFLVDLFDSIRNNTRFESYAHEPGLLKKLFNPKIMKFHKKALKKAKSNSKKRS